jgi:hypothetical protein
VLKCGAKLDENKFYVKMWRKIGRKTNFVLKCGVKLDEKQILY